MSDEPKMPDVIYARPAVKWIRLVVSPDDDDTPYLRCDIDPDDAVVVKRAAVEKMRVGILEKGTTIAALQAKHDALCEAVKHIDEVYCMNVDGQTLADAIDSALELIAQQDQPTVR